MSAFLLGEHQPSASIITIGQDRSPKTLRNPLVTLPWGWEGLAASLLQGELLLHTVMYCPWELSTCSLSVVRSRIYSVPSKCKVWLSYVLQWAFSTWHVPILNIVSLLSCPVLCLVCSIFTQNPLPSSFLVAWHGKKLRKYKEERESPW